MTTTTRTDQETLWALWRAVLTTLLDRLTSTPPGEVQASLLNVARAFLVDNGIYVGGLNDPGQMKRGLSKMVETIPDFSGDWMRAREDL